MKNQLDHELCERYPKIFKNRTASINESCMAWGFDCGDGWFNILNQLCANIQNHIDWKNEQRARLLIDNPYNSKIPEEVAQVIADQVKEKFGTLRFYYTGGDDRIDGMVFMAESMSAVTCETCGAPGKLRGDRWVYTACDEHTLEKDRDTVEITEDDMI